MTMLLTFSVFFSNRLLLLSDDVSESDVMLTVILRFSLRIIGVSCFDETTCGADGQAVIVWVGGAASGTGGLKWRIWVVLSINKNIIVFWITCGNSPSECACNVDEVDRQDLPDEMTLTSSDYRLFCLMFLLTRLLLTKTFRWFVIFCSSIFSWIFWGLRPMYCPNSVSRSFFVTNFAISEFLTQTSGLFGSLIMLAVGLILPTLLPRSRTSYNPSKFFFSLWLAWIYRAILT